MVPKADSGTFLLLFLLVLSITEPLRPGRGGGGVGGGDAGTGPAPLLGPGLRLGCGAGPAHTSGAVLEGERGPRRPAGG